MTSAYRLGNTSSLTTVASSGTTLITGLYGTLAIAADGTYTYTVDDDNALVEALRTTANTLVDKFVYTISDGKGGTASSTLSVTVHGKNDAPFAYNDYNVAKESIAASNNYTLSDTTGYKAVGNVLPNDTDVDTGDSKSVVGITGTATVQSSTTIYNT